MLTKHFKQLTPFLILFLLLGLLGHELFAAISSKQAPGLIGEELPTFSLPALSNPQKRFSSKDLHGKVCLLNVWASWCHACKMEHGMLMKIKNNYHIPIYGILYKDTPSTALRWLISKGDPYQTVGNDQTGDTAIDLGIYGTPETFVISPEGKVLYRQAGMIDEETWTHTIYPLIKQYEKKA